jgi:hypothetical protein
MRKFIPIGLILILAACNVMPTPHNPRQGVYLGEADFVAALKVANAYAAMPRCSGIVKPPCSDQKIVDKASMAADKADVAVTTAKNVAMNATSTDPEVSSSSAAANEAIAALLKIVPHQPAAHR